MQLAFSNVDRSLATNERVDDLLSAANSHLSTDTMRALYFANDALNLADTLNRPDRQLSALAIIIDALKASDRATDATPYIGRAIDLALTINDQATIDSLIGTLGQWAIDLERESGPPRGSSIRGQAPPMRWLVATLARLERDRVTSPAPHVVADAPTSLDDRRNNLGIDDPETGLLNSRGLTAELIRLDEQRSGFALLQITVLPTNHPIREIADHMVEIVGNRGTVARTGSGVLTGLLPDVTGINAMIMAEQLRSALGRLEETKAISVGIGVAIKQPDESSRDVLRRVADRAEEAAFEPGVSVAG